MQKCTQCHRAGPQLGLCGSFMLCPGRTAKQGHIDPHSANFPQVDTAKDIVVECKACGQTVALPAHDLLIGETRVDFRCSRSAAHCEAVVVHPVKEAAFIVLPEDHTKERIPTTPQPTAAQLAKAMKSPKGAK